MHRKGRGFNNCKLLFLIFIWLVTQITKILYISSFSVRTLKHLVKMEPNFEHIIYKSLDSVLNHLQKKEFKQLESVQKLLDTYEKVVADNSTQNQEKKFPLIVLEGLDGCGKSTITERVKRKLNGELFCTPPPCIKAIRDDFDSPEYREVRTAYYALGNYMAAMEMRTKLQKTPIVLDRFWHSTAAYAIAQAVADNPELEEIPPKDDPIYNWPEDLMQPDIIAYLCVNEEVRLKRIRNRPSFTEQENLLKNQPAFRKNVIDVYYRIIPEMKFINAQLSPNKTTKQILEHVRPFMDLSHLDG